MTNFPYSDEAEWSVVGQMLSHPERVAEAIGQQLELDDFYRPDCRLIFEAIVYSYYADEPIDPVVIGDRLATPLASQWSVEAPEVPQRLYQQAAARQHMDNVADHAGLIKRHSTNRRLLTLCVGIEQQVTEGQLSPEEIGDYLTTEASKITTGGKKRSQLIKHIDVGREYVKHLQQQMAAREQGIELAVYTGLKFVDHWTKGHGPGELMIVGGPPGVGKSAVTWSMATGFARRQKAKMEQGRPPVGTLVFSLEMPLVGSAGRIATADTQIDSDRLREGNISHDELSNIIKTWKNDEDLPLYWNFASNFRMSQMRALIVEAIRKYNVGYIVVDHFRMFDPDRRINNPNQEDEAKARFLKEDVAKDLNVAVLCLAHTIKLSREVSDGRPTLNDLRGSGQVAAHCDIVAFMHMPWMFATEVEMAEGLVTATEAEMIYRKNRSGALGTARFGFEASKMDVYDT